MEEEEVSEAMEEEQVSEALCPKGSIRILRREHR
jgi:hypothetical protein